MCTITLAATLASRHCCTPLQRLCAPRDPCTRRARDYRFGEVQEVELNGLAGLNRVYEVEWQ